MAHSAGPVRNHKRTGCPCRVTQLDLRRAAAPTSVASFGRSAPGSQIRRAAAPPTLNGASDGRSTRPCALAAYPPATASPYRAQTGSAASTRALWSPSSTVGRLPRSQFREVCLPCFTERSRQAQPTPVAAEQARVQPSGVVLPSNCRGQDRHVIQVALDWVREVKAPVS
jgi:hypothetical protein